MKKLFSIFFITSLIAYLPVQGLSQTSSPTSSQTVPDILIEKLGIKYQLQDLTKDIRTQFEQNPFQLPDDVNEKMLDEFSTVYSADALLESFKSMFQKQVDDEYTPAIQEWLNTENIQKVNQAITEFYTLQGLRKRVVTMYEMDQNPPSEQRLTLINDLADITNTKDNTIESSVIIFRSLLQKLNTLSELQNLPDTQIEALVNNFRTQIQQQAQEQVSNQFLVKFHNIDDNELRNYISFYKSEAGQWLSTAISKSMQAAFETAASKFTASN